MALTAPTSDDDVMASINITPFTDVLLVLLIIFIILASVTKDTTLPKARNHTRVEASQIVVYIDKHNHIQVGSHQTDVAHAPAAFRKLQEDTGNAYDSVIIKADPDADYGTILQVMDAAKDEKLTNFGLANQVESSRS